MSRPLPPSRCPGCGYEMDTVTAITHRTGRIAPKDGDVALCLNCGHVMIFEGNRQRPPTRDEMRTLADDPKLCKAIGLIGRTWAKQ